MRWGKVRAWLSGWWAWVRIIFMVFGFLYVFSFAVGWGLTAGAHLSGYAPVTIEVQR